MTTSPKITSTAELLRAHAAVDLEDLGRALLARTTLSSGHGAVTVEVSDATVRLTRSSDAHRPYGAELEFPFSVEELWSEVRDLDGYLADDEVSGIEFALDIASDDESHDAVDYLAPIWRIYPSQLVEAIGGGWKQANIRNPGVVLDDEGDIAEMSPVWFASGDPLIVALGVTGAYVLVAEPFEVPIGMHGPAHVDIDVIESVLRDDPQFLPKVRDAVRRASDSKIETMEVCWGCRQFKIPFQVRPSDVAYCLECMKSHFGLILD